MNTRNSECLPEMEDLKRLFLSNPKNFGEKMIQSIRNGSIDWVDVWKWSVTMDNQSFTSTNVLMKIMEEAFKSKNYTVRCQAFKCWEHLLLNHEKISSPDIVRVSVTPLIANNHSEYDVLEIKIPVILTFLKTDLLVTNKDICYRAVNSFLKILYGPHLYQPASTYPTLTFPSAQIYKIMLEKTSHNEKYRDLVLSYLDKVIPTLVNKGEFRILAGQIWTSALGLMCPEWLPCEFKVIISALRSLTDPSVVDPVLISSLLTILVTIYSSFTLRQNAKGDLSVLLSCLVLIPSQTKMKTLLDRIVHKFKMSPIFISVFFDVLTSMSATHKINPTDHWITTVDYLISWLSNRKIKRTVETESLCCVTVLLFPVICLFFRWIDAVSKKWKRLIHECILRFNFNSSCIVELLDKFRTFVNNSDQTVSSLVASATLCELMMKCTTDREAAQPIRDVLTALSRKGLLFIDFPDCEHGDFVKILITAQNEYVSIYNECPDEFIPFLTFNKNQKAKTKGECTEPATEDKSDVGHSGTVVGGSKNTNSKSRPMFLSKLGSMNKRSSVPSTSSVRSSSKSSAKNSDEETTFVAIAPRKKVIPLTEHQKEVKKMKKYVPALYEDLSQSQTDSASLLTLENKKTAETNGPEHLDENASLGNCHSNKAGRIDAPLSFKNCIKSPSTSNAATEANGCISEDERNQNQNVEINSRSDSKVPRISKDIVGSKIPNGDSESGSKRKNKKDAVETPTKKSRRSSKIPNGDAFPDRISENQSVEMDVEDSLSILNKPPDPVIVTPERNNDAIVISSTPSPTEKMVDDTPTRIRRRRPKIVPALTPRSPIYTRKRKSIMERNDGFIYTDLKFKRKAIVSPKTEESSRFVQIPPSIDDECGSIVDGVSGLAVDTNGETDAGIIRSENSNTVNVIDETQPEQTVNGVQSLDSVIFVENPPTEVINLDDSFSSANEMEVEFKTINVQDDLEESMAGCAKRKKRSVNCSKLKHYQKYVKSKTVREKGNVYKTRSRKSRSSTSTVVDNDSTFFELDPVTENRLDAINQDDVVASSDTLVDNNPTTTTDSSRGIDVTSNAQADHDSTLANSETNVDSEQNCSTSVDAVDETDAVENDASVDGSNQNTDDNCNRSNQNCTELVSNLQMPVMRLTSLNLFDEQSIPVSNTVNDCDNEQREQLDKCDTDSLIRRNDGPGKVVSVDAESRPTNKLSSVEREQLLRNRINSLNWNETRKEYAAASAVELDTSSAPHKSSLASSKRNMGSDKTSPHADIETDDDIVENSQPVKVSSPLSGNSRSSHILNLLGKSKSTGAGEEKHKNSGQTYKRHSSHTASSCVTGRTTRMMKMLENSTKSNKLASSPGPPNKLKFCPKVCVSPGILKKPDANNISPKSQKMANLLLFLREELNLEMLVFNKAKRYEFYSQADNYIVSGVQLNHEKMLVMNRVVNFADPVLTSTREFMEDGSYTDSIIGPDDLEDTVSELMYEENLNSQELLYQPLKDCPDDIGIITEQLFGTSWAKQAKSYLNRLGIYKIGQLANMSTITAQSIPAGDNRISRLRKALEAYDKHSATTRKVMRLPSARRRICDNEDTNKSCSISDLLEKIENDENNPELLSLCAEGSETNSVIVALATDTNDGVGEIENVIIQDKEIAAMEVEMEECNKSNSTSDFQEPEPAQTNVADENERRTTNGAEEIESAITNEMDEMEPDRVSTFESDQGNETECENTGDAEGNMNEVEPDHMNETEDIHEAVPDDDESKPDNTNEAECNHTNAVVPDHMIVSEAEHDYTVDAENKTVCSYDVEHNYSHSPDKLNDNCVMDATMLDECNEMVPEVFETLDALEDVTTIEDVRNGNEQRPTVITSLHYKMTISNEDEFIEEEPQTSFSDLEPEDNQNTEDVITDVAAVPSTVPDTESETDIEILSENGEFSSPKKNLADDNVTTVECETPKTIGSPAIFSSTSSTPDSKQEAILAAFDMGMELSGNKSVSCQTDVSGSQTSVYCQTDKSLNQTSVYCQTDESSPSTSSVISHVTMFRREPGDSPETFVESEIDISVIRLLMVALSERYHDSNTVRRETSSDDYCIDMFTFILDLLERHNIDRSKARAFLRSVRKYTR